MTTTRTAKPTARQAEMLRRASHVNKDGQIGFGPAAFGGHKGTYDALLRKGWMIEHSYEEVSRFLGKRTACLAQITDAGRAALELAD